MEEEDHPKHRYTSTRQSDVTLQIIAVAESSAKRRTQSSLNTYEGWNFNSGNYLFTTDTK